MSGVCSRGLRGAGLGSRVHLRPRGLAALAGRPGRTLRRPERGARGGGGMGGAAWHALALVVYQDDGG